MTDITSNITFDNENGKITKCVLQIGEKTFTVTLVKGGYEVKEEGTVTASAATPAVTPAASPAVTPAANPANPAGSATTPAPSAPPAHLAPLKPEEYDTPENLIEKLVQHGYTAPQ